MKDKVRVIFRPIVKMLVSFGIHPNVLTLTGTIVTVIAGLLYARGSFVLASLVLLFAGIFDVLDGDVARLGGKVSKYGAFLDSTLDRFTEFFVFSGLIYFFRDEFKLVFLLLTSLFLSFMVSYTRARGEGLGYSTKKGPMDRPARYFFIIVISFFPVGHFVFYIIVFIILTFITVIRRIFDLVRLEKIKEV